MRKLLNKSHTNVHTIALILGGVSVFGYILSILRYRAFAHYFGENELVDVYVASFQIPDVLFIVATAFISVYALLPMFEEKMRKSESDLKEFINTSFYFLTFFLLLGGTILFFAIPHLGKWLFGNFSPEGFEMFVLFSRMYIIQASLFAISSFFIALLQLKRKFLLYSLLPLLYNIGIIIGVIVLYPMFGAVGLALGVLLGVAVNVAIQLPILLQNNILPKLAPTRRTVRECWRTVKMSIPRASALLSHTTITTIIVFSVVADISEGALSIYYYADGLRAVPIGIIGTAYSVAAFPILVTHFTENNMNAFREVIGNALRRLLFFILPIIVFVLMLREQLVSLLLETGHFTAETTAVTAVIAGVFIISALTTSILVICARALYACGRSIEAFFIFFALSATKIVLLYTVVPFIKSSSAATALIQQITGLDSAAHGVLFVAILIVVIPEIFAAAAMLTVLVRRIQQNLRPLFQALMQNTIGVAVLAVAVAVPNALFFSELHFNSVAGILAIAGMSVIGAAAWFTTLCLLKNKESEVLKKKALKIVSRVWNT